MLVMKVQLGQICDAVKSTVPQEMWRAIVEKLEELEQHHPEALDVGMNSFDDADVAWVCWTRSLLLAPPRPHSPQPATSMPSRLAQTRSGFLIISTRCFLERCANERYCGAAKILPTADAYLEPWTMLGRLSARNRIGRLYLGVGVTDTGRRNPAVTAQAAATLHLLTRGRAILGIGPGEREGNEPYGVDWTKPVARFEEALATIRTLWNSGGELVNRDSPYFPLRNAIFDLPRIEGRGPDLDWCARTPQAARRGPLRRWLFPWVPPPPTRLRTSSGDRPRGGTSDAGRDPTSLVPAVMLTVTTGRNRDDVNEALESVVSQPRCK